MILDKKVSVLGALQLAANSTSTIGQVQGPLDEDDLNNEVSSPFVISCNDHSVGGDDVVPGTDSRGDAIYGSIEDISTDSHSVPAFQEGRNDLSGQIAKISISHDGEYATAVCMAAEEPMDGDVGGETAARGLY